MRVQVRYDSYADDHLLYVVSGEGSTLLGHDWLRDIRLNWQSLGMAYVQGKPPSLLSLLQKV